MVPRYVWLMKNHKIAKNSTNTIAGTKISTYLESLKFQEFFDVRLTKFENNQILLNKISQISTDNPAIYWVKEPHDDTS